MVNFLLDKYYNNNITNYVDLYWDGSISINCGMDPSEEPLLFSRTNRFTMVNKCSLNEWKERIECILRNKSEIDNYNYLNDVTKIQFCVNFENEIDIINENDIISENDTNSENDIISDNSNEIISENDSDSDNQ